MKTTAIRIGTTGTLDGTECHRLQLEGEQSAVRESHIVMPTSCIRRNDCKN